MTDRVVELSDKERVSAPTRTRRKIDHAVAVGSGTIAPMTPPLCFIGDCHGEDRWVAHVLKRAEAGGAKVAWALGDFGYWCHTPSGVRFLDRVQGYAEGRGIDLIFLRGNHENQEQLALLADGATGLVPVRPNVAFAPDGTIWEHAGLRFAVAGGAPSIDMDQRTPGLDWWPTETLSVAGSERLAAAGPVDVVLAHDCPLEVAMSGLHDWPPGDAHREVMSSVADLLTPRWWFSAHYHRKVSEMVTTRRGHHVRAEILACEGTMTLGWLLVDPAALTVDGSDPRIHPAAGKLTPNRISLRWSPSGAFPEDGGRVPGGAVVGERRRGTAPHGGRRRVPRPWVRDAPSEEAGESISGETPPTADGCRTTKPA